MRTWFSRLAVAALAAVLVLFLILWFRPTPARPAVPIPPVSVVNGNAALTLSAALVAPQDGLLPLALLVNGRATGGSKGALKQEWPGFRASARFSGSAVWVRFQDGANRWRITLDRGRTGHVDLSRPGVQDLHIRGLRPGEHLIEVEKISESSMPASFGGILIDGAAEALPAPQAAARLIEFIGDSDTVGFANGAETRDCTEEEVFSATDTSRSFGPQVAAALGADYRIIARSGIGLVRNYGGAKPEAVMKLRYGVTLPSNPRATGLPQRPADIVVTGLGSNDFGSDFAPDEPWSDQQALSRDFEPALIGFLRDRVRENPAALQVLLAFGEYGDPLVKPYEAAEAALRADGARVVLVTLPELERSACFWHPSAQDHAMIAERLTQAITGAGG